MRNITPTLPILEVAQVKAVGVARESAQGQVATNTESIIQNASSGRT
ncbi:Uncharacterised protein [Vibrio cholerae]|nr:Uncharacterised protein [Vibrio cholerae]CSI91880.1 Uncharacterised protein [Vibrio cholerae]